MIFDSISHLQCYKGISINLDLAIDYLCKTELTSLPLGRNEVAGDDVYVNVMEVETHVPGQEYHLEAHKKYLDIHIDLEGREALAVTTLEAVREDTPYDQDGDCAMYWGSAQTLCSLESGLFALCFPQDAHEPGIAVQKPEKLKKAVVKIAW